MSSASAKARKTQSAFDAFFVSYVETALWASEDDDGVRLSKRYDPKDIDKSTLVEMEREASDFFEVNLKDVSKNPGQAGHEFWMCRNGYGWSARMWPKEAEDRLKKSAVKFGKYELQTSEDVVFGFPR
jgi:hypothetical protein